MTTTTVEARRGPARLGLVMSLVAATILGATATLAALRESNETPRSDDPAAAGHRAQEPLERSHSGRDWAVDLAVSATSLRSTLPVVVWGERRIDLLEHNSGVRVATITISGTSSYPMAITRRSAAELLVSDKSYDHGEETSRVLIFDLDNGLALKRELVLRASRSTYTLYWSAMNLSPDESILFYVTHSTRIELPECSGGVLILGNVCDRIGLEAIDLTSVGAEIAPAEMPQGCPPPHRAPAADPKSLLVTCNNGQGWEARVAEGRVTLSPLPPVDVPTDDLRSREGKPSVAVYTVPVGTQSYGTLFANGDFVMRRAEPGSKRAVPEGMRPLARGDALHRLQSGKLLIAFGHPEELGYPAGVALFDPATGVIERTVSLDPSKTLSVVPSPGGDGFHALERSGAVRQAAFTDGKVVTVGNSGSMPWAVSLVP